MITKKRINRTNDAFGEYRKNPEEAYNHVGMDFGRFQIPKTIVCQRLAMHYQNGIKMIGLVPLIKKFCKFFIDVDYISGKCNIHTFFKKANDYVEKTWGKDYTSTIFVLKSRTEYKFHIYYPKIIVNKNALIYHWKYMNKLFDDCKPIDENATSLRFEGFWKFDSKITKRYLANTDYHPFKLESTEKFEINEQFYQQTYLPIDDECTATEVINTPLENDEQFQTSQSFTTINDQSEILEESRYSEIESEVDMDWQQTQASHHTSSQLSTSTVNLSQITSTSFSEFNSNLDNSNLSLPTDLESNNSQDGLIIGVNPVNVFGIEITNLMNTKYKELKPYLTEHTISKLQIHNQNTPKEIVTFCLGKTDKDRYCPFQQRRHHQNNNYFVWNLKSGSLRRKCHNNRCKNKYEIVFSKQTIFDNCMDEEDMTADADLCTQYLKFNPNVMYSTKYKTKNSDGCFFHYNEQTGIWERDINSYKLKQHLQQDFRKFLFEKLNKKIEDSRNSMEVRKFHLSQKREINKKLGNQTPTNNVINALKTYCKSKDDLDGNPDYIVVENGVVDLVKQELVIPQREELVTDICVANVKFEERDEEKITHINKDLINKLFILEDVRNVVLKYMSTTLDGRVLKKFLINLGPGGDNGKSRFCEIFKFLLGSYAYRANSKFICGKDDDKSMANFHRKRFIYFEEPTVSKPIETNKIKEYTGGVEAAHRRIYSDDTEILLQATFILNTNTHPEFTTADKALRNRVITYYWTSVFTKDARKVDESKHIYLANDYIGSKAWTKEYGSQLFNILLDYYKLFLADNRTVEMSKTLQEKSDEVIRMSDTFLDWFNNNFEFTENKKHFICLSEIEQMFRESDIWKHLSNKAKSIGCKTWLLRQIRNRPGLIKNYVKEKWFAKDKKRKYDGYMLGCVVKDRNHNNLNADEQHNYFNSEDEDVYMMINDENTNSSNVIANSTNTRYAAIGRKRRRLSTKNQSQELTYEQVTKRRKVMQALNPDLADNQQDDPVD